MMNKLRIHSLSQSNSASTKTTAFLAATIGALLLAADIPANAQSDEIPTYSVLYTFTGEAEGAFPKATNSLAMDREGNLYGVSANGGVSSNVGCGYGCGSVFKVSRKGKESIEYEFTGVPTDSQGPNSNVIRDEEVISTARPSTSSTKSAVLAMKRNSTTSQVEPRAGRITVLVMV